jgi:AcrR family transcriptional regulator
MNEVVNVGAETRLKILDAAERLMGEMGLEVPLRAITTEAGVNLGAVNYHFHSKNALLDAIIARHFTPVSQRRLQMLDSIEARYPEGPLPLEEVLDAFFRPVFESMGEKSHIRPLIGKIYSAPKEFINRVYERHLTGIVQRFTPALQRALPGLPPDELFWRLHFAVGMMVHVLNWAAVLPFISNGACEIGDPGETTARMVAFAAAGFRAPLPDLEKH